MTIAVRRCIRGLLDFPATCRNSLDQWSTDSGKRHLDPFPGLCQRDLAGDGDTAMKRFRTFFQNMTLGGLTVVLPGFLLVHDFSVALSLGDRPDPASDRRGRVPGASAGNPGRLPGNRPHHRALLFAGDCWSEPASDDSFIRILKIESWPSHRGIGLSKKPSCNSWGASAHRFLRWRSFGSTIGRR